MSQPKPEMVTVTLDHLNGEMVVSRTPRQQWVSMCWHLYRMQQDIAQAARHTPGTTTA